MNRFALFLLIFIGPVLLNGLVGCTDCGSDSGPIRYRIGGYNLSLQKAGIDPSLPSAIANVSPGDTVAARYLHIRLIGEEVHSSYLTGDGNSAFACDPAVIPLDVIKSLSIVSDQSFNADLPAGANLTSVLSVESGSRAAVEYFSQPNIPAQSYVFTFIKSPEKTARHRLTTQVELRNGKIFADTAMAVTIKPY